MKKTLNTLEVRKKRSLKYEKISSVVYTCCLFILTQFSPFLLTIYVYCHMHIKSMKEKSEKLIPQFNIPSCKYYLIHKDKQVPATQQLFFHIRFYVKF